MLFRLLRAHLRPYRRRTALLVLLQLVQIMGTLLLPTLGAAVIDNGIVKEDSDYILQLGAIMLAVAVVQILAAIGAVSLGSRTAMAMGRDIRSAVFRRVMDFSAREVGEFGTPSLMNRTTNDVQQVQTLAQSAFGIAISAPFMCVGSVALAMQQDTQLSLLLVGLIVAIALGFGVLLARMGALYGRMQIYLDRINRILREHITGVRVIRAFVRDKHERVRFIRANAELLDVALRVSRLIALMLPAVLMIMNVFMIALLWLGARRIGSGEMQVGALSAFLSYLALILMSVVMLSFVFMSVPRATVSATRIREILDSSTSVAPPAQPAVTDSRKTGHLALRDVEFRYPGAEEPVLRGIDLASEPGQTVAIVGSTGSGKTTLLNLVLRLFDATSGAVLINGTDIRELDPATLTRTVGFVPQKPYLFTGTIASNMRFGDPDATDADIWRALEIAQARDFVERMPDGLDSAIAQGGTNISGGQRQRLSIARALLRKPDIYLFDDCFSALDYATDAALRAALEPETANATVVTVAQRISTVEHADHILVLDEGRVVGSGTHDELMRDNTTYREIAFSQLTTKEAAHGGLAQ